CDALSSPLLNSADTASHDNMPLLDPPPHRGHRIHNDQSDGLKLRVRKSQIITIAFAVSFHSRTAMSTSQRASESYKLKTHSDVFLTTTSTHSAPPPPSSFDSNRSTLPTSLHHIGFGSFRPHDH